MERVQKLQQLYDSALAQKLKSSCKNKFVNQKQQQVHQHYQRQCQDWRKYHNRRRIRDWWKLEYFSRVGIKT